MNQLIQGPRIQPAQANPGNTERMNRMMMMKTLCMFNDHVFQTLCLFTLQAHRQIGRQRCIKRKKITPPQPIEKQVAGAIFCPNFCSPTVYVTQAVGLVFAQFLQPHSLCYIGCGGIFCPKNYSLLLLRMAARFRTLRGDRVAARFRVPLHEQHPSWFIILLPKDCAIHILKEYIFPEVSNYSLCLYLYSYFFILRFWSKSKRSNVMRMSPFGLSDILGRSLMMTSPS